MTKKKPKSDHEVYEFLPDDSITTAEIIELTKLVRIGVGGNSLEKATPELKRHFKKVA